MWNHNGVQNDKTNMTGCMVISNLSSKRDYVSSQAGAQEREKEREVDAPCHKGTGQN